MGEGITRDSMYIVYKWLLLKFDAETCERWRIRTGASAEGFAILEIGHIAADQVYF